MSFGTLSKFNSTSPVYGLLRNMSLYGLNLSTVGLHYIYDLEIILKKLKMKIRYFEFLQNQFVPLKKLKASTVLKILVEYFL